MKRCQVRSSEPGFRVAALFSVLLFSLAGCGSGGSDRVSLGDWTLDPGGVMLTEDLRVSETENFYFGSTSELDVTSDGYMVVADRSATKIKVLRPDGSLVDTLGREGQGPGEFDRLRSAQVARGDSVYAFDLQQSRVTVFSPGPAHEVARTLTIPREQGWILGVMVFDGYLVGDFNARSEPKDGVSAGPPQPLRVVSESGIPGDTILMSRQSRVAIATRDGGFRIHGLPFARRTLVETAPDGRVYTGWTDSLRISACGRDGRSETVADIPVELVPVTEAERDSVLNDIDHNGIRADVQSAMPNTKPPFTDLVVADDGRLWVQRPADDPDAETVAWWMLDPETKTIREVHLPPEVNVEVVQEGKAYGTTTTETGAPAVVRYTIQRTN